MTRSALDGEDPDRLYTVTGGRSSADDIDLDLVTLIVRESEPSAGLQFEHVRILEIAAKPTSVVELSSYLSLPVSVIKILLADLLATGKVSARHPSSAQAAGRTSDSEFLKKVLVGLRNL